MKSLDHKNIDNENCLYIIFNNVDGYIIECSEDKYLIFASTGKKILIVKIVFTLFLIM